MNHTMDTHYLRVSAHDGDINAAAIVAAWKFAAEGKYAQAFAEFKHAAELGRTPYDEWGDLLEASGNRTEALRAYQQIVYATSIVYGPKGTVIPDPNAHDWKNAQGRSLRELVLKQPMNGRPNDVGNSNYSPSAYLRYALLLVKSGQYEEAIQVRKWAVDTLGSSRSNVFKDYDWLKTEFTASAIRRDPSLFIAQAWTIIGLFDKTRRTDDFPGLVAIERYKKAIAARSDFAPAQVLLAKYYRYMGEHFDETYLPLALAALENAKYYGKGDTRAAALAAMKEIKEGKQISQFHELYQQ